MWHVLLLSIISYFGRQDEDVTRNPEYAAYLHDIYQHTIPNITVNELKKVMKKGVVILDTREADEYEISHIRHARHVGYIWFDMRHVYDIPKTDTVIVYCTIGNRSERVGEKLKRAGYQHVFNLFGGLYEWVNWRNPIYNRNDIQTTLIHGYNKEWQRWLENGSPVY